MTDRDQLAALIFPLLDDHDVKLDWDDAQLIADAIIAAGWRAPGPPRTAIKLNEPNPDAIQVRCPDCDRDPGQPCYEIQQENLNGVSWTSFVVNFRAGTYHYAREQASQLIARRPVD